MEETAQAIDAWRRAGLSHGGLSGLVERFSVSAAASDPAFIQYATRDQLRAQVDALIARVRAGEAEAETLPLFGVPFAVKDNIDVAGFATTAACPAYAYEPGVDAEVVARLRRAGAIMVGKTNLDQFATGLVGTRSPYGTVPCAFDATRIGGGSSSGSASVVTRGLVPFALGTDTAGSGRVPAALQNIVGYKPTRGRWSTRGVVPACRTLDCVSVFTLTVQDAATVAAVVEGYDPQDPYSRSLPAPAPRLSASPPRIALPDRLTFFDDQEAHAAFHATLDHVRGMGWELSILDFSPFAELAALLYSSPWVVERYLVARELLAREPQALDPTVRRILQGAKGDSAAAMFEAEYRRAELARAIALQLEGHDALLVPSVPTHYRIAEVAADPLGTNARMGTYTNFTNLADLCGLAVPGVFRRDGLPAGVTLLAPAFCESRLVALGVQLQDSLALPRGATGVRL